jgi:hypothetical protein
MPVLKVAQRVLTAHCQPLLFQFSKWHRGLDNLQDLGYTRGMEMREFPNSQISKKLKKVKKRKNQKSQILRFLSFLDF